MTSHTDMLIDTEKLLTLALDGFPNFTLSELVELTDWMVCKLRDGDCNENQKNALLEASCQALSNAVPLATLSSNLDDLKLLGRCLDSFDDVLETALQSADTELRTLLARYQGHTQRRKQVVADAIAVVQSFNVQPLEYEYASEEELVRGRYAK